VTTGHRHRRRTHPPLIRDTIPARPRDIEVLLLPITVRHHLTDIPTAPLLLMATDQDRTVVPAVITSSGADHHHRDRDRRVMVEGAQAVAVAEGVGGISCASRPLGRTWEQRLT
jgi:hypothetical protein